MRDDTDENRGQDDTVAVLIADVMAEGLAAYDAEGAKIGYVRRFDLEAGYMVVEEGMLARRDLYIPFHLMQSSTPHEIYLNVSMDALTDAYLLPPAARTRIEEQIDPETGRTEVVLTHELQSGYDGHPVQIMPVRLGELTRTMTVSMTVLDADDAYAGEVMRIDTTRGLLTVRGSLSNEAVRTVPFSMVAHVNADLGVVTLLVPSVAIPPER
ncbi:MAG: hypothetical protein ACXWQR_09335 [Ktedonobacterales bacterium]